LRSRGWKGGERLSMRIGGGDIRVDEFGRGGGACAYFLSHFHGDHTGGLRKGWGHGPLYCSSVTAGLLREQLGLDGGLVRVMTPGTRVRLPLGGPDATVRAIGANHCPGAVMFHFEFPDRNVLYTGDFRLDDDIRREAAALAGVDVAYVDNTYDDPRYVFPSLGESIEQVLELVGKHMDNEVFLAVYSIGKTKLLRAVVERFGRPVYVSANTARCYRAMGMDDLVTRDASTTNLRGYARGYYFKYFRWRHRRHRRTHTVIIPTGWALDADDDPHGYFYVPYSEHCDYRELREFLGLLRPKKVIPI